MQRSKNSMFTIMLLLYAISIGAREIRDICRHLEEFKGKLEESVEYHREDTKDADIQKYRILRSKDCSLGVNGFVNLYQSKYGKFEQGKTLTIITIINNEGLDAGDPDYFAKRFISTMIKYTSKKHDNNPLDSLCITIDEITTSQLKDFEKPQITVENFKMFLDRSKELINDALIKIAVIDCKEIIFKGVKNCLKNPIIDPHKSISIATYHFKVIEKIRKTLPDIIFKIKTEKRHDTSFSQWFEGYGDKFSILCDLRRQIIEYGATLGIKNFSEGYSDFFDFFVGHIYLNDSAPFYKCKKDFSDLILTEMESLANKKMLENLLFNAYHGKFRHLNFISRYVKSSNSAIDAKFPYFQDISSDKYLNKRLEKYFKECKFDEKRKLLEEKYKSVCKSPIEKITRIIIEKPIDDKSIFPLYRILKEEGILDRPHEYPLVFISDRIKEECYEYKVVQNNTKKRIVDMINDQGSVQIATETVQQQLLTQPVDSDAIGNALQSSTYASDASTHSNDKATQPILDKDIPNKIVITIDNNDKFSNDDNLVWLNTALERKCIDPERNLVSRKLKITIFNSFGTSHVFIVLQSNKVTKFEQLSFIYNVQCTDTEGNCLIFGHPNRRINCFDNVPGSFLDGLLFALQYALINSCDNFRIPNLLAIKNIDYVFCEKFVNMKPCRVFSNLVRNVDGTLSKMKVHEDNRIYMELKDLYEFYTNRKEYIHCKIQRLARQCDMDEEDLQKILFKFVLNKPCVDGNIERSVPSLSEYVLRASIILWLEKSDNNRLTLHIWDVREIAYNRFLLTNLPRLFRKSLEIVMKIPIKQEYKAIMGKYNPSKIACLITNDICTYMGPRDVFNCCNQTEIYKTYYMHYVLDRIGKLIISEQLQTALTNSNKNGKAFDLKELLSTLKLEMGPPLLERVDAVFEEFKRIIDKQFIRITSISYGKKDKDKKLQEPANVDSIVEAEYYNCAKKLGTGTDGISNI